MDLLGSPQPAYPSIHIAGTNGKTSTARMVDALLSAFGLRTGRTTSPHLQSASSASPSTASRSTPERFVATYDEIEPFVELVDGAVEQRTARG